MIGQDKQKHEHAEWHSIVVWKKLAGFATEYLEGTLRSRYWENAKKESQKNRSHCEQSNFIR